MASIMGSGGFAWKFAWKISKGFGYLTEKGRETFATVDLLVELVSPSRSNAVIHGEGGNFSGDISKHNKNVSHWPSGPVIELLYIALSAIVSENRCLNNSNEHADQINWRPRFHTSKANIDVTR